MIFLTVGTQFPFDRLVRGIDQAFNDGLIGEEIFAQIGESSYKPRNFESVASLEKKVFDKCLKEASSIISHAGMGTIIMALDNEKPLLAMPRSKKYGEVVNDHQLTIAKRFSKLGYILAVYGIDDLPDGIRELKNFLPQRRKASSRAVVNRIHRFLSGLS